MKKKLIPILATLLTLAMIFTLAACGDKPDDPTESDTTTVDDTIDVVVTDPVVDTTEFIEDTTDETSTDEDTTTEADPNVTTDPTATTDPNTTTKAPEADPFAPPANLGSLGKAEQVAYFNKVANRVRTDKPGFTQDYSKIISNMKFTGVVSLVQGIIDNLVAGLTGAEDPKVVAKGKDNKGDFLSEITPFELKASDVASISSKKSGNNWVMTVKIISETNPAKPTGSANARAYSIASRQEVLDEITGFASVITADVNDASLLYNGGTINLTVNEKGQVIAGDYIFLVNATANNVKISILSTNVTALMTVNSKYRDFKW